MVDGDVTHPPTAGIISITPPLDEANFADGTVLFTLDIDKADESFVDLTSWVFGDIKCEDLLKDALPLPICLCSPNFEDVFS